jgi:hypothetical protein
MRYMITVNEWVLGWAAYKPNTIVFKHCTILSIGRVVIVK